MEKQQNTHQEEDMNNFSDLKDFCRKCYEEAERMNTNNSKEFKSVERNAQKYDEEMETKRLEKLRKGSKSWRYNYTYRRPTTTSLP